MADARSGSGRDSGEALAALAGGPADPDSAFHDPDSPGNPAPHVPDDHDLNSASPGVSRGPGHDQANAGADADANAVAGAEDVTGTAPLAVDRDPGTGATAHRPTQAAARPATRATSTTATGPTVPRRRMVIRVQPRPHPDPRAKRPNRRANRSGRPPAIGLPLLLVLALSALFVSWVSAEPFWLAVGHQDSGKVEVTRCSGEGDLGRRCVGTFVASGGAYAVDLASVSGAAPEDREVGRTLPARMVSETGRIAYAGDAAGLHLRWLTGLFLLLLIGFGVAWATGAWRFHGAARAVAALASLAAPLVIGAVALSLAW